MPSAFMFIANACYYGTGRGDNDVPSFWSSPAFPLMNIDYYLVLADEWTRKTTNHRPRTAVWWQSPLFLSRPRNHYHHQQLHRPIFFLPLSTTYTTRSRRFSLCSKQQWTMKCIFELQVTSKHSPTDDDKMRGSFFCPPHPLTDCPPIHPSIQPSLWWWSSSLC